MNEDKLILGGHEFTSRFILGSGRFLWSWSRPASNRRERRSSLWRSAVQTKGVLPIS